MDDDGLPPNLWELAVAWVIAYLGAIALALMLAESAMKLFE